ncbi:MAG: glycosyltransferase [Phycisphaerales bacterium]|nr:glycosyltransferase [Phycisphaerales bacterium]
MAASDAITRMNAMVAEGRLAEAAQFAQQPIGDPRVDAELKNLGALVNLRMGDLAAAIASGEEATRLSPDLASYQVNLARLYAMASHWDEAIARCEEGIRLAPAFGDAHALLCETLLACGRAGAAIERADAALSLIPKDPAIHFVRAQSLRNVGRASEAIAGFEALTLLTPSDERAISALAGATLYDSSRSPQHVTEMHRRYGRTVQRFHPCTPLPREPRPDHLPLRVGLVSGDIRAHSVSFFLESLLVGADRSTITLHAYPTDARSDIITERLSARFETWRCIEGLSADAAAKRMREDQIDVLIDLSGHTRGARLDVFRRRPAPVQATYLGYPATTGLPSIGWRIVDSLTDPPGLSDTLCVERLVRLDPCFLCYTPPADAPLPQRAPGSPPTFGSFNALAKLSDACVQLWAGVLKACPDARLRLKSIALMDPLIGRDVASRFERCGVNPSRIESIGWNTSMQDHLALYHGVDVALDTTPYAGTTTTCEALWMGVPVVTLAGPSHASRVGASLLTSVGLGDLVARDHGEFVQAARDLMLDMPRRHGLRHTLRETMRTSPLCDAEGFSRRFEAMIRELWSRRDEGVVPPA